jgi:hypothetical protein
MKLFACSDFSGHYLSGCAVMLAESESEAREMLSAELAKQGLVEHNEPNELRLREIPLGVQSVDILFNGDY